jgi:hypothetical protein
LLFTLGVGNSLYGLQRMKSEPDAIRQLVAALTDKCKASVLPLSAQEIGNALYGLQVILI